MSFQRVHYDFKVSRVDPKRPELTGLVTLEVHYKGSILSRGDALVLVMDAWMDATTREGLNPVEAFQVIAKEKYGVKDQDKKKKH